MRMSKALKEVIKVKINDEDGNEVETALAIKPPSAQVKQQARLIHAKAYREAVEAGAMLREQLDTQLRKSDLWDDQRQAEFDKLRTAILEGERKLAKKGIKLKEARQIAIDISKHRNDLQDLLSQRNRIDVNTADAIADQAQFNFFVAACTVYNDGKRENKPFFTKDGEHPSIDAYIDQSTEEVGISAATKLGEMMYGSEKEMLAKLPENQFLTKYKFVDGDFHLINENGDRVDEHGRRVDKDGRYVNEKGEYVDSDGNLVDKDGRYIESENDFFLDDDGNPIKDEQEKPLPAPEPKVPEEPKAPSKPERPKTVEVDLAKGAVVKE
jgi:hypothetical protein